MLTKTPVRLSDFILENMESILTDIALDLKTPQTLLEQSEKSKGNAPRGDHETAAETHAEARLLSGYSVEQLVSEYRALRSSVLHQWTSQMAARQATDMEDVTRFNEAIDQALAESVARYAHLVKQSENMFLAILGHDLRNPLGTVITGATFVMRATDIPSKYVLAATRIFNSGQRMSKLIGDLIDFTRTHLGSGIPIKPKRMDVAEVCMNVVEELRTSHPERIVDFSSFRREEVFADDDRLAQVFSNLIGNALQYGAHDQPIRVGISSTEQEVSVTVNNKGPVIPAKKLGSVFDPLVRLAVREDSGDLRETSLGIGMFIAREIVNAHNGSITVESNEGEGTTFRMTVPRRLPPRSRVDDPR
jgi:signal transduction histidine kinase